MNLIKSPKRIISLLLAISVLIGTLPICSTFANTEGKEILKNSSLEFTENGGVYSIEDWKITDSVQYKILHKVYTDSDGVNVVELQSVDTDRGVALTSNTNLSSALESDKFYKFSVWVKLEDPTMPKNEVGDLATFYRAHTGAYMFYKFSNKEVYKSTIITEKTDWQQLSFIIDASKVPTDGWDYFFGVKLYGIRGKLSIKQPTISVYDPDALDYKPKIETTNLLSNGDFSQYDATIAHTGGNRFTGFSIAGRANNCVNHEQIQVELNGKTVTAAKLTYDGTSYDTKDALFKEVHKVIATDKYYRISTWIKVTSSSYDNTFEVGYNGNIKFGCDKNNGNVSVAKSDAITAECDWRQISLIVNGADWDNDNWDSRIGIWVYRMNCDIYLADMRVEEFVGAVNIATENQQPDSSLANGDFESYDEDTNTFTGWSFYNGNGKNNTISRVEGVTGSALMITNVSSDHSLTSASTTVTVDPTKNYNVSVKVKATATSSGTWQAPSWGGNIRLAVSDPSGKMATVETKHINTKTEDWKELTLNLTDIPEGVTELKITLKTGSTGCNAYFDDVKIIPITDGKVEVSRTNAYAGELVEVKAVPADGYKISKLYYTNGIDSVNITETKKTVAVSATVDGYDGTVYKSIASDKIYSFTMPANADVTVKAEFVTDDTEITPTPTPTPDPEPEETAILKNGGFEKYSSGEFENWSFSKGGNAQNSITQDEGRTGKAAVITDTDTDYIASLSQTVTLDRTKNYKFSVYVKPTSTDDQDFYAPSWGGAYIKVKSGSYAVESDKITSAGRFKKYSLIIEGGKLPEGNSTVTVSFVMQYMRGVFLLDDAQIVEYNGEQDEEEKLEDLYNLSFEDGKDDNFEDWNKSIPNSTVTVTASKTSHDGDRSALFTSTNRNNVASIQQTINNIDTSKRYLLTAYAKALGELDVAYTGGGARLGVIYKDAQGNKMTLSSAGVRDLTDWTKLKFYFQIPEGSTEVTARLYIDCVAGKVIFDDIALKVVGDAIPLTDGQLANNGFEYYYDGEFPMWSFSNGGNAQNSITQDDGRTGKAAVITDTNTDHILSLSQSVTLDKSKNWKISFYVKATATDEQNFYVPSWGGAYVKATAGDYSVESVKLTSTARFRKYSVIIEGDKLPQEKTAVKVAFVMQYMRGVIYLDDVTVTEYNGEPDEPEVFEDLYNLSFEEGKGNSFEDWTKSVPNSKVTITASNDAHDGKRAVLFTSTDRNNVATLYQTINNCDTALRYRLTVYAKTPFEPDVAYDGGGIKLRVSYTDKDGKLQNSSSAGKRELADWTKLYVDYQIPKGATNVRAVLMIDCFKGEVLFDDMTIECIGKAVKMPIQDKENIAPNFSFENGQDGSFLGWYYWGNSAKNCSCVTGEPRSGAQSAKLINKETSNSSQLSWDTSGLDTSKYYQFTAWVKTKNVLPLVNGQGGARINIQFKKPNSNENLKTYTSEFLIGTNGWTQLRVVGKFPENCTRAIFALSFSQASGEVWFDDVDIRVVDYVDTNLLKNGQFNDFEEDGMLLNWETNTNDWAFASFMAEDGIATVENSSFCTSYYCQQVSGLEIGKTYVLSGSIATSFLVSKTAGGNVLAEFTDVYGNVIETYCATDYLTDTTDDWNRFAVSLTVPEGCKAVRVLLAGVDSVGQVRFSNLSLCTEADYIGSDVTKAEKIKNLVLDLVEATKQPMASDTDNQRKISPAMLAVIIAGAVLVIGAGVAVPLIIKRKKH